ncbi:hypothetical protein ACG3SL_04225 [Sphingomonas sp. CJ20]
MSAASLLSSGKAGSVALVAGAGTSVVRRALQCAPRGGGDLHHQPGRRDAGALGTGAPRPARGGRGALYRAGDRRGLDAAVLTAWQSGTLIFRQMPLRQVVAELNRYRRGRIPDERDHGFPPGERHLLCRPARRFFSQAEPALGLTVWRLPGNVVVPG